MRSAHAALSAFPVWRGRGGRSPCGDWRLEAKGGQERGRIGICTICAYSPRSVSVAIDRLNLTLKRTAGLGTLVNRREEKGWDVM